MVDVMTQPTNFGFGEEEVLLRDSARKFFEDKLPVDQLHTLVAGDSDPHRSLEARWRPELWQQMVELGWTMLAVPETAGGIGMNAAAVAGLCEEAGRAAFPAPLLATINATYVLAACKSDAATRALEQLSGGASASLALLNESGSLLAGDTDVVVRDKMLHGTAAYVQDAQKVDHFLVKARDGGDIGLYWLPADMEGLSIEPNAIVDLTRDQARLQFKGVPAVRVGEKAEVVLKQAMPAIWTLTSADMVGAGEWLLQTTAEYARVRKQFDREIGFFQAIKHPLVNVMIDIDQSKSLVYNAACAIDHEPELAIQYAHMAKAAASDMARFSASRAVQSHGGIGFTWESYIHVYFKRQMHNQLLWGDSAWHRAALAELLIGPVAA
jgi:alkylation response protein AidB-like acyl-CoA dehydrogenase